MNEILLGLKNTLGIVFMTLAVGIPFGALLALAIDSNSPLKPVAKLYISFFRSVPLMLVLLGFYLVAPSLLKNLFGIHGDIRLYTAMLGFTLFESAYFAGHFLSGLNAVSEDQKKAAKAQGLSSFQTFRHITLPQAFKNCLPSTIGQSVILLQDTTTVVAIGLADLYGKIVFVQEKSGHNTQGILIATAIYISISLFGMWMIEKFKQKSST